MNAKRFHISHCWRIRHISPGPTISENHGAPTSSLPSDAHTSISGRRFSSFKNVEFSSKYTYVMKNKLKPVQSGTSCTTLIV